jgi:hypothetical protein
MHRFRYFTETLPASDNPHDHTTQASVIQALGGLGGHWVRIDAQTIVGYATLPADVFTKLVQGHDTVALCPSLHDKKTVHAHLTTHNNGKHSVHFDRLQKVAKLTPDDTTADVVGKLVEMGHVFLAPDM